MSVERSPFAIAIPVLSEFRQITDPTAYAPLPAEWTIGIADVEGSTDAIEAGRYKAVNMAGAAVIAAVSNALDRRPFPFVFGGDGASFAVPPADAPAALEALRRTATLVGEEFALTLRIAAVPVAAIRAAGYDVRVARVAASHDVAYAMFSGGGLAWADQAIKGGAFGLDPASPGARPDLTGLSCRFAATPARRGLILSVIVRPTGRDDARYRALIDGILTLVERSPGMAHPLPESGLVFGWPPAGLDLEARIRRRPGASALPMKAWLFARAILSHAIFRFGWRVGGFDPVRYMGRMIANSDYRKYDDGLRMTIDCASTLADAIEARLEAAARVGTAAFGLHRQSEALLTCLSPAITADDHVHFVDGAAGGYAAAAAALKSAAAGLGVTPAR